MTTVMFEEKMYNREVVFCKVYSLESKKKLEKIFLKNRISYFVEWQDRSVFQRLFSGENNKEKTIFTIRINETDVERAKELVQGIESIKLRKTEQHN